MTVSFLLSVPGWLARFMALSREERRAVYRGWWATTKKEAYHYWVCRRRSRAASCACMERVEVQLTLWCLLPQSGTKLLFAEVKIALRLINKALHGHTLTRSACVAAAA